LTEFRSLSLSAAWRRLIVCGGVVLAGAVMGLAGPVLFGALRDKALASEKRFNEAMASHVDGEVRRIIAVLVNQGDSLAHALDCGADAQLDDALGKILEREAAIQSLRVVSGDGQGITRSSPAPAREGEIAETPTRASLAGPRPEIVIPLHGRVHVGPVRVGSGQVLLFPIGVPIGAGERPLGALVAEVDGEELWRLVAARRPHPDALTYLVDRRGRLLTSTQDRRAGALMTEKPIVRALLAGMGWDARKPYTRLTGDAVYGAVEPIDILNWGVVSEVPRAAIVQPIFGVLLSLAAVVILLTAVVCGLGVALVGRMVSPLSMLTEALVRAGKREYPTLGIRSSIREVSALTRGFDRMIAELERQEQERARAEEVLRARTRELAAADRAKNHFLARLAHELRNPLAAIANACHLLRERCPEDPEEKPVFEVLERQTQRLGRLVDDLLDVARITSGRITLREERVDLRDTLRNVLLANRQEADAKGLRCVLELPPEPLVVIGDSLRLEQIVTNLMTNAVKHTDPGGDIVLSAWTDADEAVLRVRDSGIGIQRNRLPGLFDEHARNRLGVEPARSGLGLGLIVVRELVELHGGRVSVDSDGKGLGSEFTVFLSRTAAEATSAVRLDPTPSGSSGPAHRIVMIDDDSDVTQTLTEALLRWGHEVRCACDGPKGIERVRELRPDVVLVDIGLPGMDGYDVARALRGDASLGGVRLFAITGYGQARDRERSRAAGFEQHLVKPDVLGPLRELLARPGQARARHLT
jgi:signal transduction histidine kinase